MEGWSTLLSPPECQFYYAEDWGPSGIPANDMGLPPHQDLPSGHPPLFQDIMNQGQVNINNASQVNASPGKRQMYMNSMMNQGHQSVSQGSKQQQQRQQQDSNKQQQSQQTQRGTPASALTKVAVGIPVAENNGFPKNSVQFPGAQRQGDQPPQFCGCGMGQFGCCTTGSPFCFPNNNAVPKNANLFPQDPLSLEGVIDPALMKGNNPNGPPMEGISINNNCFSGLFIPLSMSSAVPAISVGKDNMKSPLMGKTMEGEWNRPSNGETYQGHREGVYNISRPVISSLSAAGQKQLQKASCNKSKNAKGKSSNGTTESPTDPNGLRKRKRSANLDELTFDGFYPGDQILHQKYIRRWRNERNLVFYDCACGRRKAVHDLKKIKTHVEKIHANSDISIVLPPPPTTMNMAGSTGTGPHMAALSNFSSTLTSTSVHGLNSMSANSTGVPGTTLAIITADLPAERDDEIQPTNENHRHISNSLSNSSSQVIVDLPKALPPPGIRVSSGEIEADPSVQLEPSREQ